MRQRFGPRLAAILVGGLRPGELPLLGKPPIVGTAEHGKQVARVRLAEDGTADVLQMDVAERYPPDPRMLDLLKTIGGKAFDGGRMQPVM